MNNQVIELTHYQENELGTLASLSGQFIDRSAESIPYNTALDRDMWLVLCNGGEL